MRRLFWKRELCGHFAHNGRYLLGLSRGNQDSDLQFSRRNPRGWTTTELPTIALVEGAEVPILAGASARGKSVITGDQSAVELTLGGSSVSIPP